MYGISKGRTMIGGTLYDIPFVHGTPVGDLAVGTSVFLNESGAPAEYLIVHQGLPSSLYDTSCDGTWLLRKDIYERRAWNSSNVNDYANSTIHSYLNSTFLGLFDSDIQAAIKEVKIPYVNGTGNAAVASGASGLVAKIFLLSGYELGWTRSTNQYFPIDGACLSYFSSLSATDSKRIGYLNGKATGWWLRSPYISNDADALFVRPSGLYFGARCTNSYGIRPALVLPSNALFDKTTLILKGVA